MMIEVSPARAKPQHYVPALQILVLHPTIVEFYCYFSVVQKYRFFGGFVVDFSYYINL